MRTNARDKTRKKPQSAGTRRWSEQGRLVGVISIGDAVRAVVDEQQFTIKSLEKYLMSGG